MSTEIKIAVLDLYNGTENEGMRCIRALLSSYQHLPIKIDTFDIRQKEEIPDLSYDVYISSGGPGSPLADEENKWEPAYFSLLDQLLSYNADSSNGRKKFVFFICHSFQLACRHFNLAAVSKRKSMSFGVFPVHMSDAGKQDPIFNGLLDPFYVVDSRYYQVVQPNIKKIESMGAQLLCIEKERTHVPLERAVMALRFNPYMVGTQFHPEVDAEGMRLYLSKEAIKQTVIDNHGAEKWQSMIDHLDDTDKIKWTYAHILPNFIEQSIQHLNKNPK